MSVFSRFIHPIPATRRAYSFFSSKPGGRTFNSVRPPKVVSNASPLSSSDASVAGPSVKTGNALPESSANGKDELSSPHVESFTSEALHATPIAHPFAPIHPLPSAQDCRLNQFFSLHRPLLLLPQTPGAVFDAAPADAVSNLGALPPPTPMAFEEPPEASPEADADAARQLARAIVVNRLAANASFEAALRRLGLKDAEGTTRVEDMDLSSFEVHMESTKRKRRSKMKKHKLKKRRKLQRSQRLKLK